MQDDRLLEILTIRECFQFAANLKIKGSDKLKKARTDEMIKLMRLEKV